MLLALQSIPCGSAEEGPSLEDKVKTAFLYKFTKYIRWPEGGPADDFRIAVIGESGILGPLRELARERLADGRKIRVERLRNVDEIGPCHILFIASTERERLREILKKAEPKGVLTVGDGKGFAAEGVVVNFVIVDGRVRFEISRRAAGRSGLEISSQLLKLAILVKE
ncbi:MAG: YfiR family protein [Elusimicrobiota bacterium]